MMRHLGPRQQQGYFLIIAIIFILVMGFMGSLIAYLFANRAQLSVFQLNGLNTFYTAESGIEIGTRLLTMPSLSGTTPTRIACASLTSTAAITNASLGSGTFTITTINSSPIFANNTLSAAVAAGDTTVNVTSASGFAPQGRILIDREAINYAAISGNSLIGVTRGVEGTLASSHASGAAVSQYLCSLEVAAGIPNLTSPLTKRELQWSVQLENAFTVGNSAGSNFVFSHWNYPTELSWNVLSVAGGSSVSNLNAVSMLSDVDGWAVGNAVATNHVFLHWNGTSWATNIVAGCSGQNLLGISMVSSQNGFAVGVTYKSTSCNSGPARYDIIYWNGSSWTALTPSSTPSIPADNASNQNLNAVHVIDTTGDGLGDTGFAVGNKGDILQYNGSSWVAATSPTTQNLNGVYTVSTSEAWAVGNGGVILRWNGSAWSSVTSPTTGQLNSIRMMNTTAGGAATYGLAVGNGGRILTYNGSTWTSQNSTGSNLFDVDIFDTQDAYAVGAGGTIMHWNGSTWATVTSGTTAQLNGISVVTAPRTPVASWKQVFQ